jgi:hypothetical protein
MIIFDQLLKHVPPILRGVETLRAWWRVLSASLEFVYQAFSFYANQKRYTLQFNGQVIYLEHVLNDKFDNSLRRIYIDDQQASNVQPLILTRRSEQQSTVIFYHKIESNAVGSVIFRQTELQTRCSFVVFVPTSILTNNQNALRSLVNFYRVAGVNFIFQPTV